MKKRFKALHLTKYTYTILDGYQSFFRSQIINIDKDTYNMALRKLFIIPGWEAF